MSTITLETVSKSVENLAEVVKSIFPYMEGRFDRLEYRMDGFERELGDFKVHTFGFEKETKSILYDLDRHARITNERLTGVEDRLETVETKLDIVVFEVRDHDRRIVNLEQVARV